MARLDVTRDEVLAWMAASGSGPTEAARHFGIPSGTIKIWQFRMRREAGHETAKPKPRNHATSPAVLQLLPPAPPRLSMSAKVAAHIRAGIDARAERLEAVGKGESYMQSAQILVMLAERIGLVSDVVDERTTPTAAPEPVDVIAAATAILEAHGRLPAEPGADTYDPETASGETS